MVRPLLNRQGEWFLYVDILAGLTGRHTLEGMPVIGCSHDDGIQLLQVQDPAEVPGLQRLGTAGGVSQPNATPSPFVHRPRRKGPTQLAPRPHFEEVVPAACDLCPRNR